MEWQQGDFTITDDPHCVDIERTVHLLQSTYWAVRRPRAVVEQMLRHSIPFTLLHQGTQVGFGRVVTDHAVFSWVADIVIEENLRGQGLGKWLVSCMCEHPVVQHTQQVLQTRDAHGLYEQFGFSRNEKLMSTRVDGL